MKKLLFLLASALIFSVNTYAVKVTKSWGGGGIFGYKTVEEDYNSATNHTHVICRDKGLNRCKSHLAERWVQDGTTTRNLDDVMGILETSIASSSLTKGKGWYGNDIYYVWTKVGDVTTLTLYTGYDAYQICGYTYNPSNIY